MVRHFEHPFARNVPATQHVFEEWHDFIHSFWPAERNDQQRIVLSRHFTAILLSPLQMLATSAQSPRTYALSKRTLTRIATVPDKRLVPAAHGTLSRNALCRWSWPTGSRVSAALRRKSRTSSRHWLLARESRHRARSR